MKLLILTSLFASALSLPAIPVAAPLIHDPAIAAASFEISQNLPTPTPTLSLPSKAEIPLPTEKPDLKARQTIIGSGGGYTITNGGDPGWGYPGGGYPGGGETFTFTIPGGKVITLTAPPLSFTIGPVPDKN